MPSGSRLLCMPALKGLDRLVAGPDKDPELPAGLRCFHSATNSKLVTGSSCA